MQNVDWKVQNADRKIQNADRKIQNADWKVQNADKEMQNADREIQNVEEKNEATVTGKNDSRFGKKTKKQNFEDEFNKVKQGEFKKAKRDGFNEAKEDGFNVAKEDGFNVAKEDRSNVAKEDGFNVAKKDKSNKLKRLKPEKIIEGILTTLIVICLALAGYAYAKYNTLQGGHAEASVAKWSLKINGSDESSSSFNLVNTINQNDSVAEGKVAPGTSGYYDVDLDARGSETAVSYVINAQIENKPQNMKFYADEDYKVEFAPENDRIIISDTIPLHEIDEIRKVRIYWDWPLDTGNTEEEIFRNNIIDTESAGKTFTVNMFVTGSQVIPGETTANYVVYHYLENANDSNYTLYTRNVGTQTIEYDEGSNIANLDITLSSEAIDIENATYAFGSTTAGGEHVQTAQVNSDGTTAIYLYYKRNRFTLTTRSRHKCS